MPDYGDVVESHFTTWIVVCSYLASLVGCVLTTELLNLRGTGVSNVRSWYVESDTHP